MQICQQLLHCATDAQTWRWRFMNVYGYFVVAGELLSVGLGLLNWHWLFADQNQQTCDKISA